ncbi:hypothetical protein SSBR45G_46840 [Bradyrhizobium sp. SSBR45G]|uniref:hypothetical protein n=1 Tax=unclassified Bradyrhizobium TaxID=2631580 RepID=UPI002342B6A8|nr:MULTISPECIES: hypothetical protein [unclassified Bradyrhizobium]GLH79775.1 hypothetical protein SSBR45G_46840 [Bradyrhizobium sp. SSBR45G]GLH87107.1 hypothetical protein SSBR45R_45670 [Bradyrhizobium sp. SSBR45R]
MTESVLDRMKRDVIGAVRAVVFDVRNAAYSERGTPRRIPAEFYPAGWEPGEACREGRPDIAERAASHAADIDIPVWRYEPNEAALAPVVSRD